MFAQPLGELSITTLNFPCWVTLSSAEHFVCQKLQNRSGVHEAEGQGEGGGNCALFFLLKEHSRLQKGFRGWTCCRSQHASPHGATVKRSLFSTRWMRAFSVLMAHSVHQRGAWKKSKSCRIKEEDQRLILNIWGNTLSSLAFMDDC